MAEKCGNCRTCNLWFKMSDSFNESKHFGVCPECNGNLLLMNQPLAQIAKDIGLSKSAVSDKIAGVRRHGERHG